MKVNKKWGILPTQIISSRQTDKFDGEVQQAWLVYCDVIIVILF